LIEISKGREGLRPFLLALKEAAMDPFIIDAVYFELIGHSDTVRDQMRLQEFVQTTYPVLPSRKEDVEQAIKLSVLCSMEDKRRYKTISYTDYLIAAQLVRYKENILIATLNIDDFPAFIFERVSVAAYDMGDRVITIALVAYSADKMNRALEEYSHAVEAEMKK